MDYHGIQFKGSGRGSFQCPNKSFHTHGDRNYSGTFRQGSNGQAWMCHKCKEGGDIFEMASFVEGMPVGQAGAEFWTITVPHVAEAVNVKVDMQEYYKALELMKVNPEKARAQLSRDLVKDVRDAIEARKDPDKINGVYGRDYSPEVRQTLSDNFDIFFPETGDLAFLGEEHPLNDPGVIRSGSMVFPIYNQYNILIGFQSRRTNDEVKEGGKKYVYTHTFIEGEAINIFNLNKAKKAIQSERVAYCFEAQFDCMVAYVSGLENSISIGVSPNPEKLEKALKSCKTAEVVLILDNDTAGHHGTVKTAELLVDKGIGVTVFLLPEKTDADEFITKFGIDALKNPSKRMTIVEYILTVKYAELSSEHLSPSVRYLFALDYIVKYSRNVGTAVTYAKALSDLFDLKAEHDVKFDIVREMNNKKDPMVKKYNDIIENTFRDIVEEPDIEKKYGKFEESGKMLRDLSQAYATHSRSEESRELDEILIQGEENRGIIRTGIHDIDEAIKMTLGSFIVIGARPSVGKSTMVRAIAVSAIENDPDVFVLHCSLDDTKKDTMDGLIANLSGIENSIIESGNITSELMPRIEDAQRRIREWWSSRYYMVGQGRVSTVEDIASIARKITMRDESKKILLIVDNAMNLPEIASSGSQNKRMIVETVINKLHILTQAQNMVNLTMVELTKSGPYRPNITMLKETGTIEYRAKVVAMLHNDLKADNKSGIYWSDENGTKKPVLEVDFPKYKVGEPNKKVWMCMDPATNRFQSATEAQKKKWQQFALTQDKKFRQGGDDLGASGEGKQGGSFDD